MSHEPSTRGFSAWSKRRNPQICRSVAESGFVAVRFDFTLGVDPEFRAARKAHPAIRVRGLADFEISCSAAGFTPVTDEPLEGFDRFYVFDPFGNRIELLESRRGERFEGS